jgi:hypothetical protein
MSTRPKPKAWKITLFKKTVDDRAKTPKYTKSFALYVTPPLVFAITIRRIDIGGDGSEAVRITAPGVRCYCAAARKLGFVPPSPPVVTGTVGVPRLISSAVSMSSRCCFSRAATAMSSRTL